jgi:insertion element IS1 protein InsB
VACRQLRCPTCQSTNVIQHGITVQGKPRDRCKTPNCSAQTFLVEHSHQGRVPEGKQQSLEMTLNGCGIRHIVRVLHISPTTVIEELKKGPQMQHRNDLAIHPMEPHESIMKIRTVEEAEVDETWSCVGKKTQQRWLWHAVDYRTGVVLAYVLGTHQDAVFLQLKAKRRHNRPVDRVPGRSHKRLSSAIRRIGGGLTMRRKRLALQSLRSMRNTKSVVMSSS